MGKTSEKLLNIKWELFGTTIWEKSPDENMDVMEELLVEYNMTLTPEFFKALYQFCAKTQSILLLFQQHFPRTLQIRQFFDAYLADKPEASDGFEKLIRSHEYYEVNDECWHQLIKEINTVTMFEGDPMHKLTTAGTTKKNQIPLN